MPKFTVKAIANFTDAETGQPVKPGDLVAFDDEARLRHMLKIRVATLKAIHPAIKKTGKKVMVYQNLLFCIGGIETANYHLARAFQNKKITFVFRTADLEQALRLGRFCDVYIDEPEDEYKTDVLILANYDSYPWIKGRVKAGKIYQQVHADWVSMKKHTKQWANFFWRPDKDVDCVVAVTETAAKALKTAFRAPIPSKTVRNILLRPERPHRTFLSLTRLSAEKGAGRIVEMVKRFHADGREFTWFIAATASNDGIVEKELGHDPSVVFIDPGINAQGLVRSVDYLVQLSDTESYCYSAHEALLLGTPVIGTRIPEFRKIIKPGKNGWLVKLDLSDLDVEAIFDHKPTPPPAEEDIDPAWNKLLKGEL